LFEAFLYLHNGDDSGSLRKHSTYTLQLLLGPFERKVVT